MRHPMKWLGSAAAFPLMLAPIAQAEDSPTPTPTAQELETQRVKDLTAQMQAETERFKAETDRLKAQVDALGLPKVDGKTTVDTEAGKIEGWMLASGTLTAAAAAISERVGEGRIALLDSDDMLDLSKGRLLQREMDLLIRALDAAAPANCGERGTASNAAAAAFPVAAAIGAVMSLLRTDTEITGLSIENAEGALLNAIAGTAPGKYVVPGEIIRTSDVGATVVKLEALIDNRQNAQKCRVAIDARAQTAAKKRAVAAQLAVLDALIARADAYLTGIAERVDGKPSDLEIAMLGDSVLRNHPNLHVLRVRVEKAGGTLLKRSNLFTMLGAPAVGITGGVVISWRVTDPATGIAGAGGVLVCRTKLTNLSAIHQGHVRASVCGSQVTDSSYEKRNAQ